MIKTAHTSDASAIASLHRQTLKGSFLAQLGTVFLESLYIFLIKKELVLVYTEKNKVEGFVSFSFNSEGMMKKFFISCPEFILSLALKTILKPVLIKRFWETFRAPSKSKQTGDAKTSGLLPAAELLSISVNPGCQATGIGSQLLNALEKHLQETGIKKYKVIAGESLVGANNFYLKNGFVLATQIVIHGNSKSNVYTKELCL
jgi:ribosomal protein S18 acetylase RimI-like enzyme